MYRGFIGAERNVSYDNATSNLGYPKIPNTYFVISRTVPQAEKGGELGYSVVRYRFEEQPQFF